MVRPYVDEEKCVGCLKCTIICPVFCFLGDYKEKEIKPVMVVEPDECLGLGCGECVANCNQNAIEIKD